jgi:ornithine decarboxylase
MFNSLSKLAVSPLRRRVDRADVLPTVDSVVAVDRPVEPLHCLRPEVITATARRFVEAFPGDVLYAVKCNPEPRVLRALWAGGVRHFDCASAAEIRLVRLMFPDAALHFMHPVKARDAIREARCQRGVADFVFDSGAELTKIVEETAEAGRNDLGLVVRLAVEGGEAAYGLSGKFGAAPAEAAALLAAARPLARRLGVSFHVGSQCVEPAAYTRALALAGRVAADSGVAVDIVDVGGGFPVSYADTVPPALDDFLVAIDDGLRVAGLPATSRLWCEPGRALVAAGTSVVVQVQLRRGDDLYINDGVYGSLSDAGAPGFRFPVRLVRADDDPPSPQLHPFRLFGPTCDSADRMDGPFLLPADVRDGDWIEIGQLGAYGAALRTAFNGFDRARLIDVADAPLLDTPGYPLPSFTGARPRDLIRAKEYAR